MSGADAAERRAEAEHSRARTIVETGWAAYFGGMHKRKVIATLARHADDIRSMGVRRLYLFGSTARGEAGRRSDVDIFVDLKRGAQFSLFDLMELRDRLSRLLGARVDVFSRDGLHHVIRAAVVREAIRII
jgi:hypothetical protein